MLLEVTAGTRNLLQCKVSELDDTSPLESAVCVGGFLHCICEKFCTHISGKSLSRFH